MITINVSCDPLGHFPGCTDRAVEAAVGLLPQIARDAYRMLDTEDVTAEDALGYAYGYGVFPMPTDNWKGDGIWRYPGDPDLYPIARINVSGLKEELVMWVYSHSLVAVEWKGDNPPADLGVILTRMD